MNNQSPLLSAVVLPSEMSPANTSIEDKASALPWKIGLGSLLRASESEIPESDPAISSRAEGAAGGVLSTNGGGSGDG